MLWLVLQFFHQTPESPWDCLTQHLYLLLKFGQSLKPWSKLKILLHPNTLFFQTHFRVSKLYITWNWNIPWLGWWYESVFLNIAKKDIVFCWVPSHTGKSDLDLPRAKVGVPYTDFKYLISQYIFTTWQDDWNGAVMKKLHSVKPVLGDWQSSYTWCRKDEVVLCRARIGHTHLTHS